MPDLLALSADFALDVRLAMPEVTAGSVMRATDVSRLARSSSLELARRLRQWGHDVEIGGFLAGTNGKYFQQQLEAEGIHGHFVWCDGETPQHLIVTEQDNRTTTLNEQSLHIELAHFDELAAHIKAIHSQFAWVSFTGDGGLDVIGKAYKDIVDAALPAKFAVNTNGHALDVLANWNPDLLIMSARECDGAIGTRIKSIEDAQYGCEEARGWGSDMVLISLDGNGVVGYDGSEFWHAESPTVSIYSGNIVLAGALHSLIASEPFGEVVRKACAPGNDHEVTLTKLG